MGVVLALVPLSINLSELGLTSVGWYMPTEPMLFALLLLSCGLVALENWIDALPSVTWVVLAGFVWMGLTILPSDPGFAESLDLEGPVHGGVLLLARTWFQYRRKPNPALGLLLVPMCIVVSYTIVRHAGHGLRRPWVMKPAGPHLVRRRAATSPPAIAMVWKKHKTSLARVLWGLGVVWLSVGTVLSYTRAALVSLVRWAPCGRDETRGPAQALARRERGGAGWFGLVVGRAGDSTERNNQDSSTTSQTLETSPTCPRTTPTWNGSTVGRVRWPCWARPFWGWGPGTYQLSTRRFKPPPFAPASAPTTQTWATPANTWDRSQSKASGLAGRPQPVDGNVALGVQTSPNLGRPGKPGLGDGALPGHHDLLRHGVLNNFLDTDKVSAPFWGFLAILVVMDIVSQRREQERCAHLKRQLNIAVSSNRGVSPRNASSAPTICPCTSSRAWPSCPFSNDAKRSVPNGTSAASSCSTSPSV